MNNKEYRNARIEAETAGEVYTFEKYNGWYVTKFMDTDDKRELRQEYREDRKNNKAFTLEDFCGRAVIIPTETGAILKSYYTEVCEIRNGDFLKLWNGYSKTTAKHIDSFRRYYGLNGISKRDWIELPEAK